MAIELYPAVDMLGGKAVRLHQGDFARTTEYDADPCEAARRWVEEGARRLHVVDLDGARSGAPVNLENLERIARLDVPVQYGGGLRSAPDVEAAIERGAARVVLGTAAFLNPDLLDQLVVSHGDRIAVGLDVKNGRVAVQGWQERIRLSPTDAVARLVAANVKTIIYTKVDWDGTMQGADLRIASQLDAAAGDAEILYSGGIGSIDDLRQLASLGLKQLTGVIVGKALYERKFTVPEALEVL